jgi:hypothetical protein
MSDLVQRLRALPDTRPEPEPFEVWRDACGLALEAADEIERLRAALQRQVRNIDVWLATGLPAGPDESREIYEQMRAALKEPT